MTPDKMNEDKYSKEDLINYRIQRAYESLEEAQVMTRSEHYNASVNRLYYSCYYITIALLLKYDLPSSTHAGVRSQLGLHFVKTQLISKDDANTFNFLFDQRHKSDYDDFVYFKKNEVEDLNIRASNFIKNIESFIKG